MKAHLDYRAIADAEAEDFREMQALYEEYVILLAARTVREAERLRATSASRKPDE